ncbi:MAG: ABC transporter ATP-binding protein [Candidatus Cryptobacteroides sp.]|nr:ABC transporter ATP-binding protein/permease [Bacteroidales bacterium]MDD7134374.1 ABC transporter ATP-binding protein [Bacteroidales bacterium]MDY2773225.1 ABC transporter ATP-binding protein [Candidatus Cryptobacteroides sp.]
MKEFLQVIRRFVGPYKQYLAGSVILNILSAVFNIFSFTLIIPILKMIFNLESEVYTFIPWDSGASFKEMLLNNIYYYMSSLITTFGPSMTLLLLGLFLGVMTALKTGCYFGSSAVMIPMRTGIVRDIRVQVYNKVLSLPLGFFSQERKGDIIARMSGDVNEVENSITSSLDMLIKNPILILFYFGTLLFTSWQLTLFTLLVVPAMAWGMGALGKRLKRDSLEAQDKWSDTMSQVEETLSGLRIIKAFNAEEKMKRRFRRTADEHKRLVNKVAIRQASAHPVSEFLGTIMIMIVLWFGGTLILNGNDAFDAPTFIFYMVILYSVLQPIKDLSRASYNIPRGLASMERVDKILKAENNIKEIAAPVQVTGFNDKIEVKNVFFSYNGEKEVLEDINVTIPKGKTIALVGQSGSGKSTLVDLIPRYHDVESGSISIDGVDIRNLSIHGLRSLIGNVNQEAILFNDTIFNNIAFGVENATMEQVVAAAKIANAHDFIMEKEKGYETNIGDGGRMLSGGQRQRISIARAILKNPPILILDEATSALDTESEKLVQEALDRLMSSRTTIAIAHRLSTIKNADEICVMQDGRIVERGRHEELIRLNGYYKKLNDMQQL